MRTYYWSNSKFATWLRGTDKPKAETWAGWRQWHKASKEQHPVRYWIAEEGLDRIQSFIWWPIDQLYNIKYYINNRWITRTHCLTAHPRDIKPGQWRDVGNRFLPCLFNELVNFVEVEQAWHHCIWDDEAKSRFNVPWYNQGWFRLRTWRCPEAGLEYLRWAETLTNEEFLEEDKKHLAEPTYQAKAAKEIIELYNWWKNVYPNRPDPHDASGWTAIMDRHREQGRDFFDLESRSEEEKLERNAALDRCNEIEAAYNQEDEEMMIRLIRVRQSLWT
jgi:hypothetical protein